eukprot:13923.XXX_449523_446076_1 [CDS] Oithona nana genome sequencing.
MKSPPAQALTTGVAAAGGSSKGNGTSTPPTFGKSYAFRSDHSLVTVLKRSHDKPKRFQQGEIVPSHASLDSVENDKDEEEDDDDDLSYMDSEDSEAVLTRLHRFCWAICCCLCRSPRCCYNKKYYYDEDEAAAAASSEAGDNSREDEVDSDKTSAVEDNSRCLWLFSLAACLCFCQQKFSEARTRFRQMVEFAEYADPEGPGCCALLLALVSILLIIATLPFSLCMCIKVVQEYERSVIFRLGRLRKGGAKGPGIFFIIPCIDTYRKVDLRTVSFDVPPQEVLSRDSVTVTVDAVVYYRVSNPTMATNNVEDFSHSTHLLAATTLRNVLGTKYLAEILSERETISHVMEQTLDEATDPWGVKVERVEIKDVRLPVQLQRAMAAEAEAAREARAKVIAAEGEQKASRALRQAAEVIAESPSALQLRYLQTLNTISAEKNSTIIFPVPMDVISHFLTKQQR